MTHSFTIFSGPVGPLTEAESIGLTLHFLPIIMFFGVVVCVFLYIIVRLVSGPTKKTRSRKKTSSPSKTVAYNGFITKTDKKYQIVSHPYSFLLGLVGVLLFVQFFIEPYLNTASQWKETQTQWTTLYMGILFVFLAFIAAVL